ncbi:MAG: hypothetical protein COA49_02395 [Bacteroidetes bacterium]|nr:MAG: hypothetical protein COA49_02395 [Bacteroidota bacterium]
MFNTKNDLGKTSPQRDELFHLTSIVIIILLSIFAWGLESMRSPNYERVLPELLSLLDQWPVNNGDSNSNEFNVKKVQPKGLVPKHYIKKRETGLSDYRERKPSLPAPNSLDINTIDSISLESLPVFGPVLSGRTIKFRDALGGFHSIDQLREVYGLDSIAFNKVSNWFKLSAEDVALICVDTASWDIMRRHPYIGVKGARIIERYRRHHDLIEISDVRSIPQMNDSIWAVWSPYIKISSKRDKN